MGNWSFLCGPCDRSDYLFFVYSFPGQGLEKKIKTFDEFLEKGLNQEIKIQGLILKNDFGLALEKVLKEYNPNLKIKRK